jgi:hypothetical protein
MVVAWRLRQVGMLVVLVPQSSHIARSWGQDTLTWSKGDCAAERQIKCVHINSADIRIRHGVDRERRRQIPLPTAQRGL